MFLGSGSPSVYQGRNAEYNYYIDDNFNIELTAVSGVFPPNQIGTFWSWGTVHTSGTILPSSGECIEYLSNSLTCDTTPIPGSTFIPITISAL
jgi:hypothetical protein